MAQGARLGGEAWAGDRPGRSFRRTGRLRSSGTEAAPARYVAPEAHPRGDSGKGWERFLKEGSKMLKLVTENQLDDWVRANAQDAQGVIVELVWRLVAASCPKPRERRFPLGDSIGQHGPDGVLDVKDRKSVV